MRKVRVQVGADVELLSPLHVGSGLGRDAHSVRAPDGGNEPPYVAAIQRDAADAPWLPGSTIKGLLRRLADGNPATEALLGSVARRGGLIVAGAALRQPGLARHLPYAGDDLGEGVFIAAGTRIDAASGVARGSSLRHDEAVAPGGIFPLAFTIEARGADAETSCRTQLDLLLQLLAELARPSGQAIGAGQADGDGRVRLCPGTLRVTGTALDNTGVMAPWPIRAVLPECRKPPAAGRWVLHLECDGPFAVLDPSWPQRRRPDSDTPMLKAQRRSETEAVLPGASVAGALRARAAWIAALQDIREKKSPQHDRPDAVYRDRPGNPPRLTPVQRLFGVTGYRGLLEIEALEVLKPAERWEVASVKLDRFSFGPMSGGLFNTETFLGVRARLVLRLRRDTSASAEDVKRAGDLAEALIADVCSEGLMLGHGGTKGFGWFAVTRETADAE